MLRLPGTLPSPDPGKWEIANENEVQVPALTFLMMNEMMRNDLMLLLLMRAILLWILGNGMCHIMCG
jgi:hypothetical protein